MARTLFVCHNSAMKNCLFCSIANGSKDKLLWENEIAVAFKDIHPKAPLHILVVPKIHVNCLDDLADTDLAGQLLMAVRVVVDKVGLKGAYRVHINNGEAAGQVIPHLHLHVLGGFGANDVDSLREDGF